MFLQDLCEWSCGNNHIHIHKVLDLTSVLFNLSLLIKQQFNDLLEGGQCHMTTCTNLVSCIVRAEFYINKTFYYLSAMEIIFYIGYIFFILTLTCPANTIRQVRHAFAFELSYLLRYIIMTPDSQNVLLYIYNEKMKTWLSVCSEVFLTDYETFLTGFS